MKFNKNTGKRKYTLNSPQTYDKVIALRLDENLGAKKIKTFLKKQGIYLTKGAIEGWIYHNKKPFVIRIISKISKDSKELTKEKAYILGTLCGDGYISTGYRIGLSVCDKEFAEYFKHCLEKTYSIRCSLSERSQRRTNMCSTPKKQYVVSCVSKLVVQDLNRYSFSFKTFEWKVPNQIINASKDIQSSFLRGFADSEAGVRFRKAHSEISLCSGNIDSLKKIKEILKNNFEINTYLGRPYYAAPQIVITRYDSLKKFNDQIGFIIERKKEALEKALESYKRKGLRKYSKEFKLKAMTLLKQGIKHREIAKLLGTNHTNIYDWEKSSYYKET